ncbi:hypothetical protein MKX01_037651 [Papaver californicum]|nr:hypothetical protein MKX01_037651 [Papaver californicum]
MGLKSKERRRSEIHEEEKLAKIPKTEDINSSEMMKNSLKAWTNYLDMEKIVAPWALHAKLKGEHLAHSLTIALYVSELSHTYALKKRYKVIGPQMLVSFERMLADTTVLDKHKEWVQQKLKKRNTKKLLRKSKENRIRVEKEIADGSVIIDEVIKSGDTFDLTFRRVKFATGGLRRRAFFHLPADNDQDLVQKWNEEERNQTY